MLLPLVCMQVHSYIFFHIPTGKPPQTKKMLQRFREEVTEWNANAHICTGDGRSQRWLEEDSLENMHLFVQKVVESVVTSYMTSRAAAR